MAGIHQSPLLHMRFADHHFCYKTDGNFDFTSEDTMSTAVGLTLAINNSGATDENVNYTDTNFINSPR